MRNRFFLFCAAGSALCLMLLAAGQFGGFDRAVPGVASLHEPALLSVAER